MKQVLFYIFTVFFTKLLSCKQEKVGHVVLLMQQVSAGQTLILHNETAALTGELNLSGQRNVLFTWLNKNRTFKSFSEIVQNSIETF